MNRAKVILKEGREKDGDRWNEVVDFFILRTLFPSLWQPVIYMLSLLYRAHAKTCNCMKAHAHARTLMHTYTLLCLESQITKCGLNHSALCKCTNLSLRLLEKACFQSPSDISAPKEREKTNKKKKHNGSQSKY